MTRLLILDDTSALLVMVCDDASPTYFITVASHDCRVEWTRGSVLKTSGDCTTRLDLNNDDRPARMRFVKFIHLSQCW